MSVSNLPAREDKTIWSSEEGRTGNEGLTRILFPSFGLRHLKRTKKKKITTFEWKLEICLTRFFYFFSSLSLRCPIRPQRSVLSTCNVRPAETLALHSPALILVLDFFLPPSLTHPFPLSSLINLFLNLSTCILSLFLSPVNLPSTSSTPTAETVCSRVVNFSFHSSFFYKKQSCHHMYFH